MNINTNNNQETIKTPSQDAQGRWQELLSPTQVLTGQVQNLDNNKKEQKKKKKCRGDRKAQRLRRREHQQQQNASNNTNHMEQNFVSIMDDNDDLEGKEEEQIQVCL